MSTESNKKRIAVIAQAVRLPGETKGLDRIAYISNMLAENGFHVDLYTSDFQHWEKKHRETWKKQYRENNYQVVFVQEPGYNKNLDLARIISHKRLSSALSEKLDDSSGYDLVYCLLPPNDLAKAASEYAIKHNIPFVVDVSDLWPEAMKMVFDIPILSNIAFWPFAKDARKAYKHASAAIGTSDEYSRRPLKDNDRLQHVTVHVGNDLEVFDDNVMKCKSLVAKPQEEFWVAYAGTLGTSYDIETLCLAAKEVSKKHPNVKVKILGDGPDKSYMEAFAEDNDCPVSFLGYKEYPEMCAWLAQSDVLVNSLVKNAAQSIVSKVADYLAAGKPIVNTGSSNEFRHMVERYNVGVNVEPENVEELSRAIEKLYLNESTRIEMGRNGRILAEAEFDRNTCYQRILDLIGSMVEKDNGIC